MNANKLMIGDWVELNGVQMKVAGISYDREEKEYTIDFFDDNHEIYHAYENLDSVEPIPLTDEILAKNFDKQSDLVYGENYDYSTDFTDVSIFEFSDGIWCVTVDEVEMGGLPNWNMYASHVHQLQHALLLAGVDKEIEL